MCVACQFGGHSKDSMYLLHKSGASFGKIWTAKIDANGGSWHLGWEDLMAEFTWVSQEAWASSQHGSLGLLETKDGIGLLEHIFSEQSRICIVFYDLALKLLIFIVYL